MTRHRRSRRGAGLFALYAVASLVPIGALGGVLVQGYAREGLSHALDEGRAQAAVIGQMAIAPALSGADLATGLTREEEDRLSTATQLAIFQGSVAHLRLLGFDGTVSFSDDGRRVGIVPTEDPAFRAATDGRVDARVVPAGSSTSAPLIRVLQPVVTESNGQAVGVLEVSLPYRDIEVAVRADTHAAVRRLAFGLLGLYAVMALISWWTTRALRRFAADHEHQALHDPLTGLANRELFRRSAEGALARSRHGARGALVLIDLDRFKEVNDTLGHHAGDELLRVVAQRLEGLLRTDDTVARLGGDEFGLVLPQGGDRKETVRLLTAIRDELGAEVTLAGATLQVAASFGVCFYPDDADTVEELLQHADAAMYQGKNGPTGVVVYQPADARPAQETLGLLRELRLALDRHELVLHYQPKVHLGSGRVTGVEALLRWQHPERGLLPPSAFLAAAERSEIIGPLTEWVLDRALADYAEWTRAGRDWTVAVNVSARNLCSPEFADSVRTMLEETAVPADRLHLEVTETAVAFDVATATQVIGALAGLGTVISLDDFGTGYTSLTQLRSVDVTELKIDRSFVAHLGACPQDQAIVRSLIDLGHTLGHTVTAEGVETQAVADWLTAAGCDHGQGYLWQRPVPWPQITVSSAPSTEGVCP